MIINTNRFFIGLAIVLLGLFFNQTDFTLAPSEEEENKIKEEEEEEELKKFQTDLVLGNKKGENWSIEPLPQPSKKPLVEGLPKGKYFIINIKAPRADEVIYFDAGEYTIEQFDRKFRKGLANFANEVLNVIKGKTDYKIFVQGSADYAGHESFVGYQKTGFLYPSVDYLPVNASTSGNVSFYSALSTHNIPMKFTNIHLPNLRGQFIKNSFHNTFDGLYKEPVILEGQITSIIEEKDRNAVLLLYLSDDFFAPIQN